MLDLDSLFSGPAMGNSGPEIPPPGDPGSSPAAGAEEAGRGKVWPHDETSVKDREHKAAQGFTADLPGLGAGNFGATGASSGPSLSEGVAPRNPLCRKGFRELGPVGPVGPLIFEGEGKEIANRAPGGGAASSQFALHPSAVILLIAYCRTLNIPIDEQAQALVALGNMPPGEQVRRWQEACMQRGIEPWEVLSIRAPMEGYDCSLCAHLLTRQFPGSSGRRQFHWACGKGYLILETGRGTERIWIAPPECQRFERWYPSDRR